MAWVGFGQQCNYKDTDYRFMQVFIFKYKYTIKTCMYTISALHHIINSNASQLKPLKLK